jgi:esterase/lipase superfamily enzyme
MAWGTIRTVTGGTDTILASDHNTIRGNILVISPDGIVHTFAQQSSAPSAPGAGLTAVYAKSDGALYYRAGAAGAEQSIGGNGFTKSFLLGGM